MFTHAMVSGLSLRAQLEQRWKPELPSCRQLNSTGAPQEEEAVGFLVGRISVMT